MAQQDLNEKCTKTHRCLINVLILVQICSFLSCYVAVQSIFRKRELLTFTTVILAITLLICTVVSLLISFVTVALSRTNNVKSMLVSGTVLIVIFIVSIGVAVLLQQQGATDKSSFENSFLEVLQANSENRLQNSQCCGVPLPTETIWNESLLPFSSPWSSWYYYTILNEEYIEEARRLFTLPWSCCSGSTTLCEHLAFERVSIDTTNKDMIIEELAELQRRDRVDKSHTARETVNYQSCGSSSGVISDGVGPKLIVFQVLFASTIILIGAQGLHIWRIISTHQ
ncbi:unnamed protein product [Caenorhabditis sp. 36 PRJEB53466]|nr:unnamed protein product [Caenorhabditis sp. 36 PRJEB53466]